MKGAHLRVLHFVAAERERGWTHWRTKDKGSHIEEKQNNLDRRQLMKRLFPIHMKMNGSAYFGGQTTTGAMTERLMYEEFPLHRLECLSYLLASLLAAFAGFLFHSLLLNLPGFNWTCHHFQMLSRRGRCFFASFRYCRISQHFYRGFFFWMDTDSLGGALRSRSLLRGSCQTNGPRQFLWHSSERLEANAPSRRRRARRPQRHSLADWTGCRRKSKSKIIEDYLQYMHIYESIPFPRDGLPNSESLLTWFRIIWENLLCTKLRAVVPWTPSLYSPMQGHDVERGITKVTVLSTRVLKSFVELKMKNMNVIMFPLITKKKSRKGSGWSGSKWSSEKPPPTILSNSTRRGSRIRPGYGRCMWLSQFRFVHIIESCP